MADQQPALDWSNLPAGCLTVVLQNLNFLGDRWAVRAVCRSWQHAANDAVRHAAYIAAWLPGTEPVGEKPAAVQRFLRGAFLFPSIRCLDVLELRSSFKLREIASQLQPTAFQQLENLGIATPLGECWPDGGCLASLPLAHQLKCLRLYDLKPDQGLLGLLHFTALTELSLTATADATSTDPYCLRNVSALTVLTALQALVLPAVEQEERKQLSRLTSLTRLHFEAAGEGAVGASLGPLTRLREMRIALHHRREMFIVKHPAVDFGALASLRTLETLEIANLAAYAWERLPEVDWTDQPPPAERAQGLLEALPALQSLVLRVAFCRVPGAAADREDGDAAPTAVALLDGRRYTSSLARVPVQRPGHRRPAEWYSAWWQWDVLTALDASLGPDCSSARAVHEHLHEVSGWMLLSPAVPKTYDVLGCWQRQDDGSIVAAHGIKS